MLADKRALALWLGLFFYILGTPFLTAETETELESPGLFSGDVSAETGTLWVEDDGASGYWRGGFNLNYGKNFSLGFDIGQAISNLPMVNGSVLGGAGEFVFDTRMGGLELRSGFFNHQEFNFAIDKVKLSNRGGSGFFIGAETPLYLGPFSAAPCFYYGNANWNDGDMYWFFGKPEIPSFFSFGLSLGFEQKHARPGKIKHGLGFRLALTDLAISSNENEPIFDANINGGIFYYSITLETAKTGFYAVLGWLYFKTAIAGELTNINQPYFLFPFRFYNINAFIDVNAGFALSGFRRSVGVFQYVINFGLFHIFHNGGDVDIHYQMKKLFNENESFEKIKPDFSGMGAAFLLLEGSIPAIRIGRYRLSAGLQKAFIVPWGYDKLLSSASGGPQEEPKTPDILPIIKSVLLSGLSFRASLSW